MPRPNTNLPFSNVKGYVTAETFLSRAVKRVAPSSFGPRARELQHEFDAKPENFQLFVGGFDRVKPVKDCLVDPVRETGNFEIFFSDETGHNSNNFARSVLVVAKNKKADWRDIMSLEIDADYFTKNDLTFNGKVFQAVVIEWS